jgi:predicted peptidase
MAAGEQAQKGGQSEQTFEKEITKTVSLRYLLYLPKGYGEDKDKKWPLILFLHGAGERGSNLNLVKKHGPPRLVEQGRDFPFVIVSPQCPSETWWTEELDALTALLDDVESKYAVDRNRVYLTGLSMGGFGSWALGCRYPERFAAVAPICGGGEWFLAGRLRKTPVWVFHGAKDPVVPLRESEEMVAALKRAGGDVRLTIYPEAEHDSWTETYDDPKLYEWFLSHRKDDRGR